ncbi:hypothetical protein KUM20_24225, partial [Escherichia coli]|uniref:hypothetical protein n=1 Tax=Escherichia coli TaxID=562 RepID=UPI001C38F972
FEDNPSYDTDAVNLIRASASYGFIITKASALGRFSLADSITALSSDSVSTMLGFKLLTLVVSSGDKTGVDASINQKLTGQRDGSKSEGT